MDSVGVVVVGDGQAGLAVSRELTERWVEHVVLERGRVAQTWRDRSRLIGNIQATGHDGGHDLHYRVLQQMGVTLVGHFLGAEDGRALFAPDLGDSVAFGDARYNDTRRRVAKLCAARGIPTPDMPDPPAFDARAPEAVELAGFGAAIFTSGFRPDYSGWVHLDAFDELGFPVHKDGESTAVPGLYFCGVHFLRKRKSSLLVGVGEDATIVARKIVERRGTPVAV